MEQYTNSSLDYTLKSLSSSIGQWRTPSEVTQQRKRGMKAEVIETHLEHFVTEGLAEKLLDESHVNKAYHFCRYRLTVKGALFHTEGGYRARRRNALRKAAWEWTKLVAVVLNAIALLYLTWRSIRT